MRYVSVLGRLALCLGLGVFSPASYAAPPTPELLGFQEPDYSGGPRLPDAAAAAPTAGTRIHSTGWKVEEGKRTTWDEWEEVLIKVEGPAWRWRDESGSEFTSIQFCRYCGHARASVDLSKLQALWPLQVGREVSFVRTREDLGRSWEHHVIVVGTATIDTGFGPVDTFVVREDMNAVGREWKGIRYNWYAPSLGMDIKWIERDNEGLRRDDKVVKVIAP